MKKLIYSKESKILTNWLRKHRQQQGFTVRSLAKKLQIHHSIVGKIEMGERRLDVFELVQYCQALKANPHQIINHIDAMQKKYSDDEITRNCSKTKPY